MPSVPSVTDLRERVRVWLHREPKVVVPPSILIADKDATNRQTTGRLVEALGYETLHSASLADALARLEDHDPDFVLLGFELDDAAGLEALEKIRAADPNLPVVMLAANLWDSRVAEAMRHGAVAYLAKPFDVSDLREVFGRR